MVNRKKLRIGYIFHRKLFQKYKINVEVMVTKTVFEWVRLSHHCRNLSSNSCKPFNAGIQK